LRYQHAQQSGKSLFCEITLMRHGYFSLLFSDSASDDYKSSRQMDIIKSHSQCGIRAMTFNSWKKSPGQNQELGGEVFSRA
jgi:hypothetical protein